jgi:predicted NBD/HSP70 family sugar kinase
VCGNRGCLEKYCSSIAFTNTVNAIKKTKAPLNLQAIKKLVEQGDPDCTGEYEKACGFLGIGIVNIINSFNPSIVVIGDEMAQIAPDIMLKQVLSVVKARILPDVYENMQIKISSMEKDPALYGAGIVAINQVFANLNKYIN